MSESHAFTELLRVRSSPLLVGLSEGNLRNLAAAGRVVSVAPRGFLYRQGDPAERIYLLTTGKLIFYRLAANGRRTMLDAIGPGWVVGTNSYFADAYFFTVQALEASTAVAWEAETVARLMGQHPRLAANALRHALTRVFELTEILEEFATEPVERRLARALLRLSDKLGEPMRISIRIRGLSEEELATMGGASLFTTNRVLRKWARQGVVSTGRRLLVIRDRLRLAQIAGKLTE